MDIPVSPPAAEGKGLRPLLPSVLFGPAAILWLWVLPVVVLLLLNVQAYGLVEGDMSDAQHECARLFGLAGLLNVFAGLVFFSVVWRAVRRAPDSGRFHSAWWGLPVIGAQVAYLWLAVSYGDGGELLPRSVTAWIYPPERFFYNQFAFAMPPLFWGMMRVACARPAKDKGRALLLSLGLAAAAPLALYLIALLMMGSKRSSEFGPYVVAVLVILLGLLMFVGLIRGLAVGLRDIEAWSATAERVVIVVFAFVLPLGGLWLNREIPFPNDFQAWEVYALTAANAAILLLASWQHARRPLLSLGLLCATLPFTLYFFVVFLPFLPLSILAVIVFGAGFLVVAPTVLLILHLSLLNKARRGARGRKLVTGALCFLLLPVVFTVRGLADKAALDAALDYVYAPTINREGSVYHPSLVNLRRALASHRSYKNGIYYPLLSDYYSWLVFDNLVLPDDKLARLETTFFGDAGLKDAGGSGHAKGRSRGDGRTVRDRARMPRAAQLPGSVEVASLKLGARPAGDHATVVTVALTLENTGNIPAEYRQALRLPPGVFVNGFRLHVNGVAVPGRLVEKKTALWVYTMIRDGERRDPGLLFYNAPGELELRVFPVACEVPSVVDIDFLVPGTFDEKALPLALRDPAAVVAALGGLAGLQRADDERGRLVAGRRDQAHLPSTAREPYLHLIIDRSRDNGFTGDLPAAIRTLKWAFPEARFARVTLANYNVADLVVPLTPLDELAGNASITGEVEHGLPAAGGLALDLALAHALRLHRDLDLDAPVVVGARAGGGGVPLRPVFVILGRTAAVRAPELPLAEAWGECVNGIDLRACGTDGTVKVLLAGEGGTVPLLRMGDSVRPLVAGRAVCFKPGPASDELEVWSPEAAGWRRLADVGRQPPDSPWAQAVALQLRQQDHDRSPGGAGVDLGALVKASRAGGVLLASTSYIVVENQAQWRMLDASERRKLGQNAALGFKETPAPPWVWTAGGFLAWLGFCRWRRGVRRRVAC